MKIYIPNSSKQSLGGGFTFLKSIQKGIQDVTFVNSFQECDIVLITGATITQRQEILDAKSIGKKIIFRIDNLPKDSRNRGTAFSRMFDFAKLADWLVFQSEWAKEYVGWWFEDKGLDISNKNSIIYNGVDSDSFFTNESSIRKTGRYLVVQFNRDENKRIPESFYKFHQAYRKDKNIELFVVGKFSSELVSYNFDFFAGEDVKYLGVINDPKQLGEIMRSCEFILFTAYIDASPNTLAEALACGCIPLGINPEGGSIEIVKRYEKGIRPTIQNMGKDYKKIFSKVLENN